MLEILSNADINREYVLSKIIRYNHRCRLQDESVAEHSFFVSLFCLKIMAQLNVDSETQRQVLVLAALHDTPESVTSDIPHDVKTNYPEMAKILEGIENDYYDYNWRDYLSTVYNPDSLVYNIVKLADAYSVYQYCLNESKLGNQSKEMTYIKLDTEERIRKGTREINQILEDRRREAHAN